MSEFELRESILRALEAAKENGYSFEGWTLSEIAYDIQTYDADLEDEDSQRIYDTLVYFEGIKEGPFLV